MVVIYTLFVRLGNKYEFTEQLYGLFVFLSPLDVQQYDLSLPFADNSKLVL